MSDVYIIYKNISLIPPVFYQRILHHYNVQELYNKINAYMIVIVVVMIF